MPPAALEIIEFEVDNLNDILLEHITDHVNPVLKYTVAESLYQNLLVMIRLNGVVEEFFLVN